MHYTFIVVTELMCIYRTFYPLVFFFFESHLSVDIIILLSTRSTTDRHLIRNKLYFLRVPAYIPSEM